MSQNTSPSAPGPGPSTSEGTSLSTDWVFGRHAHHRERHLGDPADGDEAKAVLRRAVELEVNFIDTAGRLRSRRERDPDRRGVAPYPDDLVNRHQGRPHAVRSNQWDADGVRSTCASVRGKPGRPEDRPDPSVPIPPARSQGPHGRSIGALVALKDEGKIRHIGVCNVTETELHPRPAAHADSCRPEPVQRGRRTSGVDGPGSVRARSASSSCRGRRSSTSRRRGAARDRQEPRTARRGRSCWPGCWPSSAIVPIPGTERSASRGECRAAGIELDAVRSRR